MTKTDRKLLSIPAAAKIIGVDKEEVRAWTRRAVDPLPTVLTGGTGRIYKVVAAEIDGWIERNMTRGTVR